MRVLCTTKKGGGGGERGFSTVRGLPQNGDGRTCMRQAEPQEILCNVGERLGVAFSIFLRWLWRNAQRSERSCQNGEGLPIQVYRDRNLFVQKLSPNQPVYIDVAQEKIQVF